MESDSTLRETYKEFAVPDNDETTEPLPTPAEARAIRARTDATPGVPGQAPRIGPAWVGAVRLPTAEQLADDETFAAMLDVMRQAEALRRAGWARPCCAVCGKLTRPASVVDGVAYHPACASCALERAFGP